MPIVAYASINSNVPNAEHDDTLYFFVNSVRAHRNYYEDLNSKLSMDPRAVIGDDPLSQNDEVSVHNKSDLNHLKSNKIINLSSVALLNMAILLQSAWKQHFCDNELKALILQDVVRTFPDEVYFRDKHIQDMMVSKVLPQNIFVI